MIETSGTIEGEALLGGGFHRLEIHMDLLKCDLWNSNKLAMYICFCLTLYVNFLSIII